MSSIIQNKFHEILGDAARTTKFTFVLPPITGDIELMNHLVYSVKALTLPTMEHQRPDQVLPKFYSDILFKRNTYFEKIF